MNITVNQKHYWWGSCASCDDAATVIVATNYVVEDESEFSAEPVCPQCGGFLGWNEGA